MSAIQLIALSPWAAVAIYAINKVYRLVLTWMVRTGHSDIFVEEGWFRFTVRRGRPDQASGASASRGRRLARVDKPTFVENPTGRSNLDANRD